jgi:enhancing lycopene biosynthesis protein 2
MHHLFIRVFFLALPMLQRVATQVRRFSTATSTKRVAVILSGCGVYDGTEVHEASAVLVHLSRAGALTSIYAPNVPQMHVVNHATGNPVEEEARNVFVEAARIARGNISPLSGLNPTEADALIIPGGFGAAKNLSNFATRGADMVVHPEVEKAIKAFHSANKPIGFCCIAPIIAAKVLPGATITMGKETAQDGRFPFFEATAVAKQLGAVHVETDIDGVVVDKANKIVTAPAFMCNTAIHQVFDNVGQMVAKVLELS